MNSVTIVELASIAKLVEAFRDCLETSQPWIWLYWKEPREVEGSVVWKEMRLQGPINERFLRWATRHYTFWQTRGSVALWMEQIVSDPHAHDGLELGW